MQIGPLQMSPIRMILLVMIVPLTIRLFTGGLGKVLPVDYLFFAHIAWMTLAMSITNPNRVIENTGSAAIEFLGAYLLGRAYIRNRSDLIAVTKLVTLIALCTLPLALLETQTGRPFALDLIRKLPGVTTYANVNNEIRMGLERAQTLFIHPIHYGLFCSMSFALIYVGMARVMSTGMRLLCSAGIGLCVFFSLSSGALLALLLQMFLIAWAVVFDKVQRRWMLLFAFFILIYIVIDLLSNRTPIRVFMSYATFSAHNAYWRSIIFEWGVMNIFGSAENGIPPAPFFGIGLNNWIRPYFMFSGSMDNFWLVMAVRNGIPGFLMLTGGYFWLLWKVGTRDLGSDRVLLDLRRGWMIAFVGLTFTLVTVHIWSSVYSFVFFMFGAGVWLMSADPEGDDTNEEADGDTEKKAIRAGGAQPRSRTGYTRFPDGLPASPRTATATQTSQRGSVRAPLRRASKPGERLR